MKPYAESCDQNREPILAILSKVLHNAQSVLEIGTGTGQHAIYFSEKLPHLQWQCSDQVQYHSGIQQWLDEATHTNVLAPLVLNVSSGTWPAQQYDAIYSANVMHIMHWENVVDLFAYGAHCLKNGGQMICYGPFSYSGKHTSDSNVQFDHYLRQRDPHSGIRDIDDLTQLAGDNGLVLINDYEMPANNRILLWQKH